MQVPAGAEEVTPPSDPTPGKTAWKTTPAAVQGEGVREGNLLAFEGVLPKQTLHSDPEKSLIPLLEQHPGRCQRDSAAAAAPDELLTSAAVTQGCSADNIKT